tara:strand:+ start:59 stop:280 length:222 start_codon:yes stop_codon:yes gene_type:complete
MMTIKTIFLTPREEFDSAIITIQDGIAIYKVELIIQVYQQRGMSENEARDFFFFNCEGVYMGPYTPRYEYDSE